MTIRLFDPVCAPEVIARGEERRLESLSGKKIGFVFNQHNSGKEFWTTLEKQIETSLKPEAVHRVYKTNTWAPAPKADLDELLRNTDDAIVGVGA